MVMLKIKKRRFYVVQAGQSIEEIAAAFSVSARLLALENGLTEQPFAGQILRIPEETGNAYVVQAGDTKALLCGSKENYVRKNGTEIFYIGMHVRI